MRKQCDKRGERCSIKYVHNYVEQKVSKAATSGELDARGCTVNLEQLPWSISEANLLAPPRSHTTPIWPQAPWDQYEGKKAFRIRWILEETSMFSDMGFCRAPTVSFTAPPLMAWPAQPDRPTLAISGTECSVHWALSGESGLLSTSVLLHLQTTIGQPKGLRGGHNITPRA